MAAVSFEQNMSINPDWGVENLMKAIDAGSAADRITPEEHENIQAMFNYKFSEADVAKFKARVKEKRKS